jgi:DNA-binding NtrC family response regulator
MDWLRPLNIIEFMIYSAVMSNKIILVVNDDDDISSLFADALEANGFKTSKSTNASLALKQIKSSPNEFALVLIDRTSQNGDFAKEVKSISSRTKVILTSAFSFLDMNISDSDYDRFLQLRVPIDVLVTTVRAALVE